MNQIDAYVTRVKRITFEYGKHFVHVWYENDFSEDERQTKLMFDTREEAKKVSKGFKFLA